MLIRPARHSDSAAIAGIWNLVIRDSVFTFDSVEKTGEEIGRLISEKAGCGHPFLVVEEAGIVGFATYGQFRPGAGYMQSMETTIHLLPEVRGRGIGRKLIGELEQCARRRGVHCLIAGISGENLDAISFHEAIGYTHAGRIPRVGLKFGRRFDLVLMQKFTAR